MNGAAAARRVDPTVPTLLAALGCAVAIRVGLAGVDGAESARAGAVFGVLVLVVVSASGWRLPCPRWRDVAIGAAGSAAILAVPVLRHLMAPGTPLGRPQIRWLAVVVLVAVAEEALLRGVLWDAMRRRYGEPAALAVTAVAFALMHAPLYGVAALPVDLAVGLILGGMRSWAGTATAPAFAHVAADVAGWWVR